MAKVHYIEQSCASALNRVRGMPFAWSLNPYRGCVHGCHYCYARATHAFLGMNAGEDFTTQIVVKTNIVAVLQRELGRTSWTGERVALGTATDAYQPCEGRYRITRGVLEALRDAATPVSVVTKSTLVLRDLDLLAALAELPGTRVNFSITTIDPALARAIEPGTPPPAQRLRVMARLAAAGVPCGVYLAPMLPGLTDSEDAIAGVASAARAHGATAFWASPLRLAPLVKEHYFAFVRETFPELFTRYQRAYPGSAAPAAYRAQIEERVARIRRAHGFFDSARTPPALAAPSERSPRAGGQLRLPL